MKVYISGQITGNRFYKLQFRLAEIKLKLKGYEPINPARVIAVLDYEDYMHIDFAMIDVCDSVYMLRNWKKSKGAKRELEYAKKIYKRIIYEE